MGMSLNSGGSYDQRGRRTRQRSRPMAEINVTPFVDVMLVLLIIFMVTAPLMTVGVEVDLPKTEAGQVKGSKEPLVVSINARGEIFIQESKTPLNMLVPRLLAISKAGYKERIYIRGDNSLRFGQISKVMGHLSGAGFSRLTVITDTEDSQ